MRSKCKEPVEIYAINNPGFKNSGQNTLEGKGAKIGEAKVTGSIIVLPFVNMNVILTRNTSATSLRAYLQLVKELKDMRI